MELSILYFTEVKLFFSMLVIMKKCYLWNLINTTYMQLTKVSLVTCLTRSLRCRKCLKMCPSLRSHVTQKGTRKSSRWRLGLVFYLLICLLRDLAGLEMGSFRWIILHKIRFLYISSPLFVKMWELKLVFALGHWSLLQFFLFIKNC